jgi:hypothetical protein
MRDQRKRPSPPKEKKEIVETIDARANNLCFRCLIPLLEKEEVKGNLYCLKCGKIMKIVFEDKR